jgi:phosphoribosylaminoimidazole-succinocarboxamide synthase
MTASAQPRTGRCDLLTSSLKSDIIPLTHMLDAFVRSNLPFPVRRGKVRDVYDLGDRLLIVATDRISAYDVIMPNGIPDKGRILNALTLFWFEKFGRQFEHHLITARFKDYPKELQKFGEQLQGRSMLVKKAQVVPIECVARGYLAGSGWKEYHRSHTVCGIPLPNGLKQSDKLPAPIFTPATKEESGHDQNISFEEMAARVGADVATQLRDKTIALYTTAATYAASRGVIIADTKFEFGRDAQGRVTLIDEVLTPDSSRFWPAEHYQPGRSQPSFDKQPLRDYLDAERRAGRWNGEAPPPPLPAHVVTATRERYLDAFRRITGTELELPVHA